MNKSVRGKWQRPDPEKYIVQMENLASEEVYLTPQGEQHAVLTDNTLDVCRGESWGVLGREAFELELLLQIIGCVRPYGSGRCKLVERGMMRKKRKILPHVFFVGDSGMAVPNMSVLEYLMFATRFTDTSPRERQVAFLEAMLESDCYAWCFAPVKQLTGQERAVLSLLAASFSDALLVIFPYFYLDTPPELRSLIAWVARRIEKKRAALLLGACDPELVQQVCSHCAFLLQGTIRQKGTLDEVTRTMDRRDYILTTPKPLVLQEALKQILPSYDVRLRDDFVDVYHSQDKSLSQARLLDLLAQMNIPVDNIRRSERTLKNAFSEAGK